MIRAIGTRTQPSVVAHADWGTSPTKRWVALAEASGPLFEAHAPVPVGDLSTYLDRLISRGGGDGCVLAGFDFPIGVPEAYAKRAGIESFPAALADFAPDFYEPADLPDEISPRRPFYPRRPGTSAQRHLVEGLGVRRMDELLRKCDRATDRRPAASPLFWTLGPKAAGKAAIVGWRDVLAPIVRRRRRGIALWPFDGELDELLAAASIVVVETYPREFYDHLGVSFRGTSKRRVEARRLAADSLLRWATATGVRLEPRLERELVAGFPGTGGDDRFDAAVGLFGMLNVVLKRRGPGAPEDLAVRSVEGWILGLGGGPGTAPAAGSGRWSFSSIDDLGAGPGFRKVREALGIRAFGANVLVIPPGVVGRPHFHEEQDELYFVHAGRARFALPGEARELGPGGLCHVESTTPRQITSVGEEPLVMLVVGARGGYVGRDGQLADPTMLG